MSVAEIGMQNWHITYSEKLNAILGCVRLGNPDLDFEIRISDLQSNAKSENGFHLRENRPQGGFQLGNPITDFMDFLFTVRLGNPKKDSQNCLVNWGLLFAYYASACKTAVPKDSFSNPFFGFPNRSVKMKIQKQISQR